MNRARIVIKRPLVHYLISLGYILAPIINIFLLVAVAGIRLPDILSRLFQGYGYLAGLWLLTAPIVGIGLYFVHKASWYLFLAHSALILADYIVKWATIPAYYQLSVSGPHHLLLLTGNLALVAAIGFIINRDFRSPYFQVLPRGWRTAHRTPLRHCVQIGGRRVGITDLSDCGCFAAAPDLAVAVGDKVDLSFQADALSIACKGEVMRRTPEGYGLRFMRLPLAQKRDIRRMLKKRFPFRFPVDATGVWIAGDRRLPVRLSDISRSGCYVAAEVAGLNEGDRGSLRMPLGRREAALPGVVVWVNGAGLHEKAMGFGLRFSRSHRRLCSEIVKLCKR
mgnify:CR=1 FL=1